MPLGPISQEFWPEYNFSVFAWKLEDCIYSGPRNKWKNHLQPKKKKGVKFCSKIPLGPTGKEFLTRIQCQHFYTNGKIFYRRRKKKKTQLNAIRKCP